MKKSRVIIGAIISLAAAFGAAVAAIDFDGYNFFDRPDGSNTLCRIDPACRFLTPGETDVARTVFGDTIDYKKIKVFTRPWCSGLRRRGSARACGTAIFIFSRTSLKLRIFPRCRPRCKRPICMS